MNRTCSKQTPLSLEQESSSLPAWGTNLPANVVDAPALVVYWRTNMVGNSFFR